MKLAKTMRPTRSILVNLSGRGDKDIGTVADLGRRVLLPPQLPSECQGNGAVRGEGDEPHRSHLCQRCKAQGRKALIPYVTAGFPIADITPTDARHGRPPGPTSSSWACRSPTRWPTAR
jgi:hypothetical protein